MAKQVNVSQAEIDGVQYRRAKTWQIALSQMNGGASMSFYILMGMVSYIANAGYGIAVAVAGFIITASRIFDGVTDPLIALLIDKVNTKFGKIRLFLMIGWLVQTIAVFMLFLWGSGGGNGIVFFVSMYAVYIIGYTFSSVSGNIIAPVMVTDPKQRPVISVWSTAYSYLVPLIVNMIITMIILPKYGNVYSVPMLAESCIFCVVLALVLNIIACIGVSGVDKPENFQGIRANKKQEKTTFRDMGRLLKGNRPLQLFIVSAASDKLAQQASSQTVINTMLYGILIGNMQLGTMFSVISMLPSIAFAVVGAKYAGKYGNKNAMVTWTYICMGLAAVGMLFCSLADMRQITVAAIPTIIFFAVMLLLNGAKMCISVVTTAMRSDIIDYELERSGKYLPGAISATYSFIDKTISAFGASIAAIGVSFIGFKTVMPQPTDSPTTPIFIMTMILLFGLPILGWIATIIAMKFYPITKETMIEVHKHIQDKKQALLDDKGELQKAAVPELEITTD